MSVGYARICPITTNKGNIMPNWVYNGLTIEGKPESITKLVDQMNQPFKILHDSWDMKTMAQVKKNTLYPAPIFAFWNIVKPTDMDAYHGPSPKVEDFAEAMKFKSDHWYDWNVRNWGTKWDVAVSGDDEAPDTYMEGPTENGDNSVVYYSFNTAWGVAYPALEKLSAQYPNLLFTLSYEEETGWGGEAEFLRGKLISNSEYGWQCKDCDAKLEEAPYCEECEYDACDTCGWNGDDLDTHKAHVVEFALTTTEGK